MRINLFMLVVVMLPAALARERLRIKIDISKHFKDVEADASGESEQVITDDELRIFGINDNVLRYGVWEISRSKPDAVFVKDSQCSWGSPYRSKGYEEVKRDVEAERATVLNVQSRPFVIDSKEITNNNAYESTVDAGLLYNFPDTISTSWGRFSGINDSRTVVEYEVRFEDRDIRLHSGLLWGQTTQNSQLTAVKGTSVRSLKSIIQLGLKETVTAELVATQIIVDLLVEYEVDFEGDVVCHYADSNIFKKFDVETVLRKNNFPENVIVSESVQLVVYPDARLLVKRNTYQGSG